MVGNVSFVGNADMLPHKSTSVYSSLNISILRKTRRRGILPDVVGSHIEGGHVKWLGLNPFFVGFIVLPIAAGPVDIVTATRKAWQNDLLNTLAITATIAVVVFLAQPVGQ